MQSSWTATADLELFSFPLGVTSYYLPSTITRISAGIGNYDKTFDYSIPEFSLYIPSSVTSIASINCFQAYNLKVYMLGATPPTFDNEMGWGDPAVIYVKSAYYSAYQSAWSTAISMGSIDLRTY